MSAIPDAWQRATSRAHGLGRRGDRLLGWLVPVGIALLAFCMRVWRLGTPDRFSFDETYYAKDAWSLLQNGYVRNYLADVDGVPVNDAIIDGRTTDLWGDGPSMEVHPEVGKWLIALGEKAFGMDPFGWRIAAVVIGSLMVLVLCRLARRLTGSTLLGCLAGLLLAFDGLHFVLSRLALLDIFLAFFLLCGVSCLVADRDWHRARMARLIDPDEPPGQGDWGPVRGLLVRPWLLTAGLCFGLALGTKWTAAYPLAAFGLLVWLWSAGARRSFGVRRAVLRSALVDGVPAFAQLVLVAVVVYVASWTAWLANAGEYEEYLSSTQYTQFVAERPCVGEGEDRTTDHETDPTRRWPTATEPDASGPAELVQSLRSLWAYHRDVYTFHTHYLNCSSHTYQSSPSGWLLINRPVGVATDLEVEPGEQGCTAAEDSTCYRQVLLIGTPILWWGGALALIAAAFLWVGTRDWRYGLAVVGAGSTWLPWLLYDDRPIFYFYAIACLPFTILAITLVLGRLIGPDPAPSRRRTAGVVAAGAFTVLVVANFAYFYPILSYEVITRDGWLDRMWFHRWI
ncbi:dolichyl-phosphate-mannose--protein mannosyltransferase [Nocardioides sp. R-C-SC26]|uniref:dolichyl-phosphate-mannose--protein mannosyltransferase n=1 Tax=Nocardioides sp. R-C-SC26 TaxID=2870414 RepID=UPI001E361CDF|nr:phospholipid carrier-dependent glycosyltransferase [Nocardioides sp. R-C-SC26]